MNTLSRAVASLVVGTAVFVVVGLGVTVALEPYVWPAALVGVVAGAVTGVAGVALTALWLTAREERRRTGRASRETVRLLWAALAAVGVGVTAGSIVTVLLSSFAVGVVSSILLAGLPVGVVSAVLAAFAVFVRSRRRRPAHRQPTP